MDATTAQHSRRIVGWSMAEHMRSELVTDALNMAVQRRRPEPGLVHHSDQGSQYVSLGFGQSARDAGIAISMGSKGDAYDNAVAESFFATLKKELIHRQSCRHRVHRGPLQPRPPPLHPRHALTSRLRGAPIRCETRRKQSDQHHQVKKCRLKQGKSRS
jgi:transposase InsO family protein